jgi:general secretion pathway protein E
VPQKRLGHVLIESAGLKPEALEQALVTQEQEGGRIGEILVRSRAATEEDVLKALGIQLGIGFAADLRFDEIDADLATRLPIGYEKQHKLLPVKREGEAILVATADPLDLGALDDVRGQLGAEVYLVLVPGQKVLDAINHVHGQKQDKGGELGEGDDDEMAGEAEELVDILDVNDEAPIIRWVNSLLFNAVKERASDIHIEPGEKDVVVRYRIDGVLYEKRRAARQFIPSIISRVKIMAGLNIAEKRLPQDGRIRRKIAGKDIDMRVATVPTAAGERVTIRLLDRSSVLLGLPDIGMPSDTLEIIRSIIERPHGILLVTGPTGSGKTTTLYACLAEINSPELNILTIEDPVEYQLEGISQTQVNPKIDLTFASGLRSFLRHDPDVIMVGEIRDRETAEIAITASLTGHFVLSTVHTNDAAGAITRLIDMGIEPFLVASSLIGCLAQRLVRRPCADCAEPVVPSEELVRELGLDPRRFFAGAYEIPAVKGQREIPPGTVLKARGCPLCLNTGYTGRTGIYELLLIDDAVRALSLQKADAAAMRKVAIEHGMVSLRMDGARKVLAGMTTPEEVLMMTAESEMQVA